MPNWDQVEGGAKEKVGGLTGDESLEREGQAQEKMGDVREKADEAKEKAEDVKEKAEDEISDRL